MSVQILGSKSEIEALAGVPTNAKALTTEGEFGNYNGTSWEWSVSSSGVAWGQITGQLEDQADLNARLFNIENVLDNRQPANNILDTLTEIDSLNHDGVVIIENHAFYNRTLADFANMLKPLLDVWYA